MKLWKFTMFKMPPTRKLGPKKNSKANGEKQYEGAIRILNTRVENIEAKGMLMLLTMELTGALQYKKN